MGGVAVRLTNRTEERLTATTSAIAWTINPNADFNINWVLMAFSAAPTTAEYITVTFKSKFGTGYDVVVFGDIKPMGFTSIRIPCIDGMEQGDSILIEYTNTDGNSISGVCSYVM